jgi:hypothetical protein
MSNDIRTTINGSTTRNLTSNSTVLLNSSQITNLASTATTTRNIVFPDNSGTVALVSDITAGLSSTIKYPALLGSTVDLGSNSTISGAPTYGALTITATLVTTNVFTVDGITLGSADNGARILFKDQTLAQHNGIWTTTISGTSLTLTRATDFDTATSEIFPGALVVVTSGTLNADTLWELATDTTPIVVGTTTLTFTSFSLKLYKEKYTSGTLPSATGNNSVAIGRASSVSVVDSILVLQILYRQGLII